MPALKIGKVGGLWTASVPDSNVRYQFLGARESDQEPNLHQFVAAIDDGRNALIAGASEIFVLPPGVTATAAIDSLFSTTDSLNYEGRPIWSCVGNDTLLDDHHEVAEALRRALRGEYAG